MHLSRRAQLLLRIGTGITMAFLYLPIVVVVVLALPGRRRRS